MSKINRLKSTITHWKNGQKETSLETNFYVFREAQSTGCASYHDLTTWDCNDIKLIIEEVGIKPDVREQ